MSYTYLALKIHFVLTFIANYRTIDFYTLIPIFKPIYTHIDTQVQSYTYRLIQSYIDIHVAFRIHFVLTFFAF
jgi:hypothetical protein